MAIMSSKTDGLSSFRYRFIPSDSSWKTPVVSPRDNNSYVDRSLSVRVSMLRSISCIFRMIRKAFWIIVKFVKPRKSIFNKPKCSIGFIEYSVTTEMSPLAASWRGRYSVNGSLEITTPAAWTDACRTTPSSLDAISMHCLTCGLLLYRSLSSAIFSKASFNDIPPGPDGISLAIVSTSV
ncbi:MAG: hypothetical protein BWY68_00764 [bacterium ADurb.Bin400]|nr:MAG: hypothetical protein BWY68_00764 [bacterium ADurb.Bin400]